jgi:DNA polymerase-3 subunit delta
MWSPRAIDDALEALLEADMALKTTKISSDEQIIANLVLSLCGVAPRRRAA